MSTLNNIDKLITHLTLQLEEANRKLEYYSYYSTFKKDNSETFSKCMEYRKIVYNKSKELKFLKEFKEVLINEMLYQKTR